MLELVRPLVVLDVETTGVHESIDRIVQIGLIKLYPDGREAPWSTLVDPGMPIPPESTECHHITDEMVAGHPTFRDLAPTLARGLHGCDLCGYNVRFDIRFLLAEFKRAGVALAPGLLDGRIIDAFRIFQLKEPRGLADAVRRYLGEEYSDGHDAMRDTTQTLRVLRAQLAEYTDLPQTVDDLHDHLNMPGGGNRVDPEGKLAWRYGEVTVNFGKKHLGKTLKEVARIDPGFFKWMLRNEFSPEVRRVVEAAVEGLFITRNK